MTYQKDILTESLKCAIRGLIEHNALHTMDDVLFDIMILVNETLPLTEEVIKSLSLFLSFSESSLWKKVAMLSALVDTSQSPDKVHVCHGVICALQGANALQSALVRYVSEASLKLNVCKSSCLALCGSAPAFACKNNVYGGLTIKEAVDVVKGQCAQS